MLTQQCDYFVLYSAYYCCTLAPNSLEFSLAFAYILLDLLLILANETLFQNINISRENNISYAASVYTCESWLDSCFGIQCSLSSSLIAPAIVLLTACSFWVSRNSGYTMCVAKKNRPPATSRLTALAAGTSRGWRRQPSCGGRRDAGNHCAEVVYESG